MFCTSGVTTSLQDVSLTLEAAAVEKGMGVFAIVGSAALGTDTAKPEATSTIGAAPATAAMRHPGLGGVAVETVELPEQCVSYPSILTTRSWLCDAELLEPGRFKIERGECGAEASAE